MRRSREQGTGIGDRGIETHFTITPNPSPLHPALQCVKIPLTCTLRASIMQSATWGCLVSTGDDVVSCKPSRPVSLKGQRQ
jgi:hypothetical protein